MVGSDTLGNATLTKANKTITLISATHAQLSSANFLVLGSDDTIFIGDNTSNIVNDNLAQATGGALDLAMLNNPTINGNNVMFGMGGGDTIVAGNGDNLIFGGRGVVDVTMARTRLLLMEAVQSAGQIVFSPMVGMIRSCSLSQLRHPKPRWYGVGWGRMTSLRGQQVEH